MWVFFLLCLKDGVNTFVNIIRGLNLRILYRSHAEKRGLLENTYRRSQVEHRLPSYEGLFMIVLNLHIDDMYNAIEFTPS